MEQSKTPVQQQQQQKVRTFKSRLVSKNLLNITLGYLAVIVVGISSFYWAKSEVDVNRQKNMKLKQEILDKQSKPNYISRIEELKQERERLSQAKK